MTSTSIPVRDKVRQFLSGFLGWFLVASIGPVVILTRPVNNEYALASLGYLLLSAGVTFVLTVALTIIFFKRRKWIAWGIIGAVAANVLAHLLIGIFMSLGITPLLWPFAPFFVVFLLV
jgi:hypothetical protein